MGIFEEVKKCADMTAVAERYGLAVRRNGFTNCIFHSDRHPSMKLYKDHYHCFGCGAHGDVISFTAKLFDLTPYDAVQKLVGEFGNSAQSDYVHTDRKHISVSEKDLLKEYIALLEKMRDDYCPASPAEQWHPLYAESLRLLPLYRYFLDILTTGTVSEQKELIQSERRVFSELRANIRRARMAVRQGRDK